MPDFFFIALGWFLGGLVNGIAGFGAALVAMPLIAPFIDLSTAVTACTLVVLILNCQVGWHFRRDIQKHYVKGIFIGAIPGVILSSVLLRHVSESHLLAGMGLFLLGYGLFNLLSGTSAAKILSPVWSYVSGFASAALGMAFGFNGPPLAAYLASSGCDAKALKGTLGAGFIITGAFIVLAKFMEGLFTGTVVIGALISVPAVLIGSRAGIWVSSFLNEAQYRKILYLGIALMGARAMLTSLL